jgi:hypothetical protein
VRVFLFSSTVRILVRKTHSSRTAEETPKTVKIRTPATHNHLQYVPNSMRFNVDQDGNPVGAAAFSWMTQEFRADAQTSPNYSMKFNQTAYERTL